MHLYNEFNSMRVANKYISETETESESESESVIDLLICDLCDNNGSVSPVSNPQDSGSFLTSDPRDNDKGVQTYRQF